MIACISLAYVAQSIVKLVLSMIRTVVVAGDHDRAVAELCHKASPCILVVEVSTESEEHHFHLVVTCQGCRANNGVVDGLIERVGIVAIKHNGTCEVLCL